MKTQHSLLLSLVIVVMLALMLFAFNGPTTSAGLLRITPAPTATPGLPPPNPTTIPLDQPLAAKEQALAQALILDAQIATWDQPWSSDTLTLEPGRISIEAFRSRAEESAASGYREWFAPEIEQDAGAVWRITIKGDVRLRILGPNANVVNQVYDGVTYVISQRTGQLLSITTGLPKK